MCENSIVNLFVFDAKEDLNSNVDIDELVDSFQETSLRGIKVEGNLTPHFSSLTLVSSQDSSTRCPHPLEAL